MPWGPLNKDSHWSSFSSSRSITAFQSRALGGAELKCELSKPVLALTQHRGLHLGGLQSRLGCFPERDGVGEVVPLLASPRMVSRGWAAVSGAEGLRPLTQGRLPPVGKTLAEFVGVLFCFP